MLVWLTLPLKIGTPTATPALRNPQTPTPGLKADTDYNGNLCDCDSVLSERCRQTNSHDLKKIIIPLYVVYNLCDCDSVLSERCRQTNSHDLKK